MPAVGFVVNVPGSLQWALVLVAAFRAGGRRGCVWCNHRPLGYDERQKTFVAVAPAAAVSGIAGNRFLVSRRLRRLRGLSGVDNNMRENLPNRITGLDLLFLEVNNLEESLKFYTEVLGFGITSNQADTQPPIASIRSGSLRITLVQQIETMLKRGRGVHFVLGVSDVHSFYESLTDQNVQLAEPRDEGWGGKFITLQDPDGYRLFFVTWE